VNDQQDDPTPAAAPGERRTSGLTLLAGAVLGGFGAVAGLSLLLFVSPAAFVSALPGLFSDGGQTSEWVVAGLSAAAAAILIVGGRFSGFRSVVITVLLVTAAGFAVHAFKSGSTQDTPGPENTCVAYSGGRQTCPGG
jgi:hypothetical protein